MKLYIGIDGGATSTRAVLIDENGKTLEKIILKKGTNLKAYEDLAPKRIIDLISDLCSKHNLSVNDINAFGLGLASVSHDEGREKLGMESLDELLSIDEIPDSPPPPEFEDEHGNIIAVTDIDSSDEEDME